MKCLIISEQHLSAYRGGNETYGDMLAEALVDSGHEVVYATENGNTVIDHKYRLRIIPPFFRLGKFFIPRFQWTSFLYVEKPDVIHVSGSGLLIYFAGLLARIYRIPAVYTFQAPLFSKGNDSFLRRIDEWLVGRIFLVVIATSPLNARYVKKRMHPLIIKTVLLALKPGFRPNARISKRQAREFLFIPKKQTVVVMVATLDEHHYYKGVETALLAMKQLPASYHLYVVGGGPLLEQYRDSVATHGLLNKVTLTGLVNNSNLVYYYQAADTVILPSTSESEGFGLVLLEAMKVKRPVVTTMCVGIAPLLKSLKIAQVIAPSKPALLADAILKPIIYQNQIANAYAFAQSRTAAVMTSETVAVYQKAIHLYET